MKKNITLLFAFIITLSTYAQSPEKLSYQSVVRNASDNLVTNQTIGMQISILGGSAAGPVVYAETQTPSTNDNGLLSIEIGAGTVVSGDFSAINWGGGNYYIKTEIDLLGGTSYTITGTSQLLSVPYALYAKESQNAKETFRLLGVARGKNESSPNPNVNNEIPSFSLTPIRWLSVIENYGSSVGGPNNTQITIPAGVTHIKIYNAIIYESGTADSMTTVAIYQDGSPFGLSNGGYPTYNQFNSKYGFIMTSQYIPVTPGQVFEIRLFQDSGNTLYLSWGSISASFSFEFYAKN